MVSAGNDMVPTVLTIWIELPAPKLPAVYPVR